MNIKKLQEVHLRLMTLDDLAQVEEIDAICFSSPWPADAFRYEIRQNTNAICWVAEGFQEKKAIIVASAVIWLILDEAHIGTLAVRPEYRGHGIGRRLLARCLLESQQVGAKKAYLEVRRDNQQAQHLYCGFGFAVVGVRPCYYPDNHEDALLMTLEVLDKAKLKSLSVA